MNDEAWENLLGTGIDNRERQNQVSRGTLYDEYKRATISFKERLSILVPSLGPKVHDLVEAVDYLTEKNQRVVSLNLLSTLRSAIRIRQRVTILYGDHGDDGHEYFSAVLQYCYQSLKPLLKEDERKEFVMALTDEVDANEMANEFEALAVDDESAEVNSEDSFTTATESWEEETVERPDEPDEDFFIMEDLIDGSDSFAAHAFLDMVDALLGEVSAAFANLKNICRQSRATSGGEKPLLGLELMKCAVVANAAMHEIRYAEQVLVAERPHLNTVYRIIGAAIFPGSVFLAEADCDDEQSRKELVRAAVAFQGDCLQMIFNDSGSLRAETWVEATAEFAEQWNLDVDFVGRMGSVPQAFASVELGNIDIHEAMDDLNFELVDEKSDDVSSDSWFSNLRNISGERSILQTLVILEVFRELAHIQDGKGIFSWKGDGGWCEIQSLEACTTKSLASAFIRPLLIEVCDKCRWGSLRGHLPCEGSMFPILRSFREYASDEQVGKPISLEFAFVVQMTLISVLELNGDDDLSRLAMAGKVSRWLTKCCASNYYTHYFSSLFSSFHY